MFTHPELVGAAPPIHEGIVAGGELVVDRDELPSAWQVIIQRERVRQRQLFNIEIVNSESQKFEKQRNIKKT